MLYIIFFNIIIYLINIRVFILRKVYITIMVLAQSAGLVEHTDCISAEK